MASAQQWLRDAKSFLNVSRLTNDDQIIINIISGDRRRRGTETGEKVGDGINEEDSSATKSENKLERSRDGKMLPKELLIKLLDSVDDFGLCFDVEKDKLQMVSFVYYDNLLIYLKLLLQICAACSSWSEKAKAFLETSVCSELKRCFEAYLDLVNKDSSKLNLPFLESIQFKRQNEDVHAISAALEESLSEVNEVEIFCVIDELAMEILKLRCEGDEIGVLTQTHGEIDLILGCISWLTATRALLSHGRYFLNEKQCPGCYNSAVLLQEVQIDELSSNFNDSIMSAALHRKVLRNHAPPPMLNSFSVLERLQCLHCLRQGIDVSDACFFELCWKGCKWGDVDLRYCQAMKEEAELLFSFQQNSSKNSRNEFLQLYSSAPILPFVDSKDEFPDSLTEEGTVKNEDTSRTITKVAVGSKRRIEHSKKEQLETRNKKRKANPDEEEMRGSTSSAVDEEPADLFLHFLDNLKFRKSKLKELVKNVAVSIIPTSLFGLIDFWLRALEIMQARLIQASRWTDSARKLLSRNPKINDQASGELLQKEADQLLIEAYANGIHSHYRYSI